MAVNWAPMFMDRLPWGNEAVKGGWAGREGERKLEAMRAFERALEKSEHVFEVTLETGDCAVRI